MTQKRKFVLLLLLCVYVYVFQTMQTLKRSARYLLSSFLDIELQTFSFNFSLQNVICTEKYLRDPPCLHC